MDDRIEALAEGGRLFQREGAITDKDLDMVMVVLVSGGDLAPSFGRTENFLGGPKISE